MTQWCVMPPSPLPYQTLRQIDGWGRNAPQSWRQEDGWSSAVLVTALLSIPPALLRSGRGPRTRLTGIPVTRGWS